MPGRPSQDSMAHNVTCQQHHCWKTQHYTDKIYWNVTINLNNWCLKTVDHNEATFPLLIKNVDYGALIFPFLSVSLFSPSSFLSSFLFIWHERNLSTIFYAHSGLLTLFWSGRKCDGREEEGWLGSEVENIGCVTKRHSFPNQLFPSLTNGLGWFSCWALLQLHSREFPAGVTSDWFIPHLDPRHLSQILLLLPPKVGVVTILPTPKGWEGSVQ